MNQFHNNIDWEVVYADQMPRIYNFFRYRLGDDLLAEDLTAATFEKGWRYRNKYRHDLSAFSTWLFTIARNLATDHLRQDKRELPLTDFHQLADDRSLEEQVQRQDDLKRLAALLSQLNARERELVSLKYGAALTNRAIAAVTGLSESNVGTILNRTVQKLRDEWEVVQ
jgi:RNA polymerase sigma-70 factor (ECF subfamily)